MYDALASERREAGQCLFGGRRRGTFNICMITKNYVLCMNKMKTGIEYHERLVRF